MLDFTDTQLPEDELIERIAFEEATHAFEKWQERMKRRKAYEFRFRGGCP